MKAQLSFNDEETEVLRMSINGPEAHYALDAIKEQCRQWIKYSELSEEEEKRLDQIRDMVQDFKYQDI